ncbi:MAG: hypothetical protein ACYTFI_16215 [Planctomycetota bacterium]|jgi:hypothetical protein
MSHLCGFTGDVRQEDDWFVRSDKPRHEKTTQGLLGGVKRDSRNPGLRSM